MAEVTVEAQPFWHPLELGVAPIIVWGQIMNWWNLLGLVPGILFYLWRGWLAWRSHTLADSLVRAEHEQLTRAQNPQSGGDASVS